MMEHRERGCVEHEQHLPAPGAEGDSSGEQGDAAVLAVEAVRPRRRRLRISRHEADFTGVLGDEAASNMTDHLLCKAGLRSPGNGSLPGAQTERRTGAGPVRSLAVR
jgi:hypothetical protein